MRGTFNCLKNNIKVKFQKQEQKQDNYKKYIKETVIQ